MGTHRTSRKVLGAAALVAGAWVFAYPRLLRTRCLTWGATAAEAARPMPGDELLPDADVVSTRAVTIHAPAAAVWPWLVQMGSGRGGAYTYDWIENLFGLGMHSADEILPEFQHLAVGDAFPLGPNRPLMQAEVVDPERALAFRFQDGNWVWSFGLYEDDGLTRLVSRNRIASSAAALSARLAGTYVMEPGSLVMERKMLYGIRDRAERLAAGTGASRRA
jgi:hypothetical protein